MTITITLTDQEMQLLRLALGVASHEVKKEREHEDITGRYMADQIIEKYATLESKLYTATLAEIRKVKQGVRS